MLLRLLDQLHGLSSLEGKCVEGLTGQKHLVQVRDLDDHTRDFGSQGRNLILVGQGCCPLHLLQNQVHVGVDQLADHVASCCLVSTHELRGVEQSSEGLLEVLPNVILLLTRVLLCGPVQRGSSLSL